MDKSFGRKVRNRLHFVLVEKLQKAGTGKVSTKNMGLVKILSVSALVLLFSVIKIPLGLAEG